MHVAEQYSFSYFCNEKHLLSNKRKVGKSEISWLDNQSTYGIKGGSKISHMGYLPQRGALAYYLAKISEKVH